MPLTLEAQQVANVLDSMDEETRAYLRDMVFRVAGRAVPLPAVAANEREQPTSPAREGRPPLRLV